jgi:hypothetical protein
VSDEKLSASTQKLPYYQIKYNESCTTNTRTNRCPWQADLPHVTKEEAPSRGTPNALGGNSHTTRASRISEQVERIPRQNQVDLDEEDAEGVRIETRLRANETER